MSECQKQQEISNALSNLERLELEITNPEFDISILKPPQTNMNTKGRKTTKVVKSSTQRMKNSKEIYEENLEKNIKKKERGKKSEEHEKIKRKLEIEERSVNLELKKRKITVIVKDENDKFVDNCSDTKVESKEIKMESSLYGRVDTYTSSKKGAVYKYLNVELISAVYAVHSVRADGSCGFWAVSSGVFKDQNKWTKVKTDMLKTYNQYKDTLYKKAVGSDSVVQYEEKE